MLLLAFTLVARSLSTGFHPVPNLDSNLVHLACIRCVVHAGT